jgi:predicted DsbA family dithiol-disulfide isomerase
VLEVVEYTDPLCPWSWGAEPTFRALRAAAGAGRGAVRIRWRRVFVLLFDTDDDPAPDPAAETAWYARYVAEVSRHTGAPRAGRLSRVAASSWPASLVAKAAEEQGERVAARVLRRLRESVFVRGEPADTASLALAAVRGVPWLDLRRLAVDARSAGTLAKVRADWAEARRPVPEVEQVDGGSPHPGAAKETPGGHRRYALPTLLLRTPDAYRAVPGWRPFEAYAEAAAALCPGPGGSRVFGGPVPPLPADRALEAYRSLTDPERRLLTEGPWPPPGAVRVDTAGGPLWLHPDEAAVHPATAPDASAAMPDAPTGL